MSDLPTMMDLLPAQRRAWDGEAWMPQLQCRCAVIVHRAFDKDRFQCAFEKAVSAHDILGMRFAVKDSDRFPSMTAGSQTSLSVITILAADEKQPELVAGNLLEECAAADVVLGRITVLVTPLADSFVFAFQLPSSIADRHSMRILARSAARQFVLETQGPCDGVPVSLIGEWLRELASSAEADAGRAYWRKTGWNEDKEGGYTLDSPTGTLPPASQNLTLGSDACRKLLELSMRELTATVGGCWAAALAKWTGQGRLTIGLLLDGRSDPILQKAFGPLSRYVPAVFEVGADRRVSEAITRLACEYENMIAWQECFLRPRSEKIGPASSFLYGIDILADDGDHDERFQILRLDGHEDRTGVKLMLRRTGLGLHIAICSGRALYPDSSIRRLGGLFAAVIERVLSESDPSIGEVWGDDLEVLPGAEAPDAETHIGELFEDCVSLHPDRIALTDGIQHLTFEALNDRAIRIAHLLKAHGVEAGHRVSIDLDRSVSAIEGIVGILRAGAAFAPTDCSEPFARSSESLRKAGIATVLTCSAQMDRYDNSFRVLPIEIGAYGRIDPGMPALSSDHLVYVLFTSGTTGLPQPAGISHRNLSNLHHGLRLAVPEFGEGGRRIGINGPLFFDTSIKQLIQILNGGTLVIFPQEARIDPEFWLRFAQEQQVEVVDLTPTHLRTLIAFGLESIPEALAAVLVGGEAIEEDLWGRLSDSRIRFYNVYGVTECTVDSTMSVVRAGGQTNIGKPLPGCFVYVLDRFLYPQPPHVTGELFIGGIGVGSGYLGMPGATAERFLPASGGERIFRTGDLVQYREDHAVEFVGRRENNTKIRGYRVSLIEIERCLCTHPGVAQAVVVAREDGRGRRLHAYVVPTLKNARTVRGKRRYELPNNLQVIHLNQGETDFLYREIFERNVYLRHGIELQKDACVLDVGANIGLFSLWAASLCPEGRIYAFEPSPAAFEALELNLQIYESNVFPFRLALSDYDGHADFTTYPSLSILSGLYSDVESERSVVQSFVNQETNHFRSAESNRLLEELIEERLRKIVHLVRIETLSQFLRRHDEPVVDLLKINAEKSELDILKGIQEEDWCRIKQVVMEVHEIDGRSREIEMLLKTRGFAVAMEEDWSLEPQRGTNYYVYARREGLEKYSGSVQRQVMAPPPLSKIHLRAYLSDRLPDYCIPSYINIVDQLPMDGRGKLDLESLSLADAAVTAECIPPTSGMEAIIVETWEEILQRGKPSVEDNFFEIGGNSLLLIDANLKLRRRLNRGVPVVEMLNHPTPRTLARYLESSPAVPETDTPAVPVQDRQAGVLRQRRRRSQVESGQEKPDQVVQ